jgi:hypothetical protein
MVAAFHLFFVCCVCVTSMNEAIMFHFKITKHKEKKICVP